ncbi:MAG: thiamine pyrophosphate-dependent dehydrogenase E1 component subunit alpha [Promethearchaeota archaeon]
MGSISEKDLSQILCIYEMMYKSRKYEEDVKKLWIDGKIPGEMHMGIGEEAIIASVVSQLIDGDYMALDHRGTSAFLLRGVDPVALLLEFMGHKEGLCKGNGGHMHLFSKDRWASSSGIVGSAGPAACGFALSLKYKKTKNIAVAFFGEGAMNQGMLMESLNLASAWSLPVLFICKDNRWAITTRSEELTGGTIIERAKSFGIESVEVDGMDVFAMLNAAYHAINTIRKGSKPYFIQAHCMHMEGHFLGDPLLRFQNDPIGEFKKVLGPLMKAVFARKGASFPKKIGNLMKTLSLISKSGAQLKKKSDPLFHFLKNLKGVKDGEKILKEIENRVDEEIEQILNRALKIYGGN